MNYRYGEIKADIRVANFEPDPDGLIRARPSGWRKNPQIGDVIMLSDAADEHALLAGVVGFEGESPNGLALLQPTSEPYLLDDGWCDLVDE